MMRALRFLRPFRKLRAGFRSGQVWPTVIITSAAAVVVMMGVDPEFPLRAWIALWFLLICPGMAFVRLLNLNDRLTELTFAIALSLAMDATTAMIMLYAQVWSPAAILIALAGQSVVGAMLQILLSFQADLRRTP